MINGIKKLFKPVDLTIGSPWKVMLFFAVPILLSTLLNNAFSLINALVLKSTVGGDSVTAINSTGNISSILFNFAYGCTSGFAVLASNKFGQKDNEGLKKVFYSSLYICLVLAILIMTIGLILYPKLLEILNVNEIYREKAGNYFQIILISFIFMLLNNNLGNILRAIGNSIAPLVISLICTLINIAFAYLFTGAIKLDTRGVAIATLLANFINFSLTAIYIYKKYPEFHLTKEGAKFDKNMTSNLLKLGIPLGFQWSILFIGSFVQSRQVNLFGDGLATKAVTCYSPFEGYITIPLSVMSSALLSFVGQNYGAGYFDRIKKGIKECILIDIIFYILILLITIPLIKYVPYIFLPATDLEGQAGELIKFYSNTYLYIVTPSLILQGLLQLSRSSLQGIKKPMIPFLSGVGELVARILVCLFIPSLINPSNPFSNESYVGICFSTPSAWLVSVLIMGLSSIYIIFIKGLENSNHVSLKNSNQ